MSYFPDHIVGFQVPASATLVGQSFPDHQFYYPFESQHLHHLPPATTTELHQLPSPTKIIEQVPTPARRGRGRSASSKVQSSRHLAGPEGQKGNADNNFKQKGDERKRQERATKSHENSTTDYIHVRARRGQATDSHSLAERVRREKISERMQMLQSLVPGCDKVTGKALKLDQIINYIQLLQTQVQYLSMKLASISPIYNDQMRQDHTMEKHDSPTQPIMDATTLADQQLLENSNLLQQVQSLFAQDGSDKDLPWNLDDRTLTQNVIDFDSYELSNAPRNY